MTPITFCLLDAARMEQHIEKAKELNAQHLSLYKGRSEEDLAAVAPYLFSYKQGDQFGSWLAENGWGNSWGVFISSRSSFDNLHKHFRKFLLVKTEDGQELYFRFYDPRVLRIFLPTCDPQQLKELFGPIDSYIMEDEDPAFAIEFWLQNYQLASRKVPASEVAGLRKPEMPPVDLDEL